MGFDINDWELSSDDAKTATDFITDTGAEVVLTDPTESGYQLVLDYDNGAVLIKDAQGNTVASYSANINLGAWSDRTEVGDTAQLTFYGGSAAFTFTVGSNRDALEITAGNLSLHPYEPLHIAYDMGSGASGDLIDWVVSDEIIMSDFGMWHYQKWAHGKAECWGQRSSAESIPVTSAWGSLYESAALYDTLPTGLFVEPPMCQPIWNATGSAGISGIEVTATGASATRTPNVHLLRPTSATVTGKLGWRCIGRWK